MKHRQVISNPFCPIAATFYYLTCFIENFICFSPSSLYNAKYRQLKYSDRRIATDETKNNLGSAFTGESEASHKYFFFAEKAEEDGQKRIARLFRAAADAETVHARNHLKVLQGVKSTRDNLLSAISGENYEFTEMYPSFIEQAEAEGEKKAANSFDLANKVEQIHHSLYQDALSKLNKGEAMELKPFFVCQHCGYTVEGEAPDKCPICGAPKRMFKPVD